MKKYPKYISEARCLGSNVYLTKKGDLIKAITRIGARDIKVKQIWEKKYNIDRNATFL